MVAVSAGAQAVCAPDGVETAATAAAASTALAPTEASARVRDTCIVVPSQNVKVSPDTTTLHRKGHDAGATPSGASVRRLRRVDLVHPGHHATTDVDRVVEAGALDDRERLGGPHAGLAVQDDLLVLG